MSNSLYACKNFSQAVKTLPCPRCVNDVYAFDTWLHYYLGDIYHNLSRKSRGKSKEQYIEMELRELEGEKEVLDLINNALNRWMNHIDNKGSLKALSLSREQYQLLSESFDRVRDKFLCDINDALSAALYGLISATELANSVNCSVIEMYQDMKSLFEAEELTSAFKNLINLRKSWAKESLN
ncbi:MAG: hypothetical protein ACOX0N_09555 [Syntrophomonadaceae bacterium]|jgi:hypothetical protein